ncbi:hypothetical protein BGX28_010188 [Mortierella sp. GBA30]|nr:hypothetical protein BGX28_010188 [Mortierella sp. GBA30]
MIWRCLYPTSTPFKNGHKNLNKNSRDTLARPATYTTTNHTKSFTERAAAYYPKDVNGVRLVDGETYCILSRSENAFEHGKGFINTQDGSWLRIGSKPELFTFHETSFGSEQRFTLAKNKVFKMSGENTRLPCTQSFMKTDKGGSLDQFVAREEHQFGNGHYYYKVMLTGHCGFGSCADYDVMGIRESGTNIKYLYAIDEACRSYTSPKISFFPKAWCEQRSK